MENRLHIAFIVHAFPSVSETFILNQITGLMDRGHMVDIFSLGRFDEPAVHEEIFSYRLSERTFYLPEVPSNWLLRSWEGLKLLRSSPRKERATLLRALNVGRYGRRAASLRLLFGVTPFLGKERYDVVHVHFGMNAFVALEMLDLEALSGKLVVTFHGYDVNVWPRAHGERCYEEVFRRADLLTVSSGFIAGRLATLGADREKMARLPVGVDLKRFRFREPSAFSAEAPLLLTVGRLVEVKGVEYAIRAFAKLSPRYPKARYLIAGDGELRGRLASLARELGVAEKVLFLGPVTREQVAKVYQQAAIFLMTGVVGADGAEEGQGLALLEAQAVGLPVVASKVGGIPESVLDGKTGFLVEPRDVEAVAERVSFLLDHPELWGPMGRAGRAHVEDSFDLQALNLRLEQTYLRLLGRPALPHTVELSSRPIQGEEQC